MAAPDEPIVRLDGLTHRYAATPALDDVTLAIPGGCLVGLIGPDGVGKSSLLGMRRRRQAHPGRLGRGARRRHGRRRATARRSARASPTCRRGSAKTSIQTSACARTSSSSRASSDRPRRARDAHRQPAGQHGPGAVRRPPGAQPVGRHAPEARALLLAHPRSRSADPRRADDGRRSALAPAVLGADRAHARSAGRT